MLVILLTACVPVVKSYQGPHYSVSEIELFTSDASERWVYFYGDPQTIYLNNTILYLQPAIDKANVWAVPGALWVSDQPVFREILPAITPPVEAIESFPFSDYYIKTSVYLKSSWMYDGRWHRLTGPLAANSEVEVEPQNEPVEFAGLTADETSVILREVLSRNSKRPVVLFELNKPIFKYYKFRPPPLQYRKTSLVVQYGLEQEFVLDFSTPETSRFSWEILSQGSMSAYRDAAPYALLAVSEQAFKHIWSLVGGNRLPRPNPPEIDFNRQSVAAFFWGMKRSGGYSIEVLDVKLTGNILKIQLNLKRPPPGSIVTQALTSPYILIAVEGKPHEVRFYDQNGVLLEKARAQ